MSKSLIVSTAIVSLIVGLGVGMSLTPEYKMASAMQAVPMDLGAADRWVDLRYINGMIAHHRSAMYLASQAQERSARPEIRELAATIIRIDTQGIADLQDLRTALYGNSREQTAFTKIELGSADETFDLRFLNALIAHHQEAITVARELRSKSTKTETLTLATEVEQSLSTGLTTLTQWRKDWYGISQ